MRLLMFSRRTTGERLLVRSHYSILFSADFFLETMASHRAQLLLTLLPTALAFGMQDVEPEIEPLKVRSEAFCMTAGTTKHVFPLRT